MKKSHFYFVILAIAALFIVQACDSDDDGSIIPDPSDDDGPVVPDSTIVSSETNITFDFYFGDKKMNLNDTFYVPDGDTLKFEEFKVLISNLKLIGESSTETATMYELIKVNDDASSSTFILKDLSVGNYKGLSFYIGLDSATNYKPSDWPALFVDEGMYWTWAEGHKFINISGKIVSDTIPEVFKSWLFHVGSNDNLRELSFENDFEITTNGASMNFRVQVESLFNNPKVINPSNNYRSVMGGSRSKDVADNYATGMIKLENISSK